jgi:hypothetical protein
MSSRQYRGTSGSSVGCGGGVGIGTILAVLISWSINHSILWAIIHGMLGWLYVIYWALFLRGM